MEEEGGFPRAKTDDGFSMDFGARTSQSGYNWLYLIFSQAVTRFTCSRVTLTDVKLLPVKSLLPVISVSLEKSTSIPTGPGFGKASDRETSSQYEQQPPKRNATHPRKRDDYAPPSDFNRLKVRYRNKKNSRSLYL